MTHVVRLALFLLVVVALVAGAASAEVQYVCPPCGLKCDAKVFDEPGRCPDCGAALVKRSTSANAAVAARPKAAILIFQGVQIIDYTGPYEVLGQAGFEVFTVAESGSALTTSMGMKVVPEFTFADAPQADVLVVPGGDVDASRKSTATLRWIKKTDAGTRHTMSVCNGAFILASAGLLDGLGATTFYRMIDDLKTEAPKTRVVSDQRFVDNGHIITTAGLSSGIDGALHLVSRMLGAGKAQAVALNMEYDWRPDSRYARAALADRLIPDAHLDAIGTWSVVSTQGSTDRWDIVVRGTSDLSATELLDRIGRTFAKAGQWSAVEDGGEGAVKSGAAAAGSPARSRWKFKGPDGKSWDGRLSVDSVAGEAGSYTLSLNIARAG